MSNFHQQIKVCFFFCSGKSKNKTYAVELEFNGNIIPEVSFISEKLLMSDYFCVVLSMRRVFLHYYCLNNFFDISKLFQESKQRKGGREYYFDLKKKDEGPYWPRLLKDNQKVRTLFLKKHLFIGIVDVLSVKNNRLV